MIRFIDLTGQIIEGDAEFSFYDTCTDAFCTFSGSQTWDTVEDFKNDYTGDDLERFLNKIPDYWKQSKIEGKILDECSGYACFVFPDERHSIKLSQSLRGLRRGANRPTAVILKIEGHFTPITLIRFLKWLAEVSFSMQ